jgi:hypothetical protein
MTDPAKVLDDLIKGLVLLAYDFARLTFFGLILPLVRYWRSLRRVWPFLTLSTTKRLSAMSYLVIWIVLVIVCGFGNFSSFAANVFGLPKKGSDYGFTVAVVLAISLLVTIFADVSLRLMLSGLQNRTRRDLYGQIGRIAVANIFCGASVILVVENYRTRNDGFRLFEPLVALIWPAHFLTHWVYPANPALSLFAVTLAIVIIKAYAIRDIKRRILVAGAILVFVPAVLISVTLWASAMVLYAFGPAVDSGSVEYALGRCTISAGKLHATAVVRLLNQETMVIDPHVFVVRSKEVLKAKDGTAFRDVGKVDGELPPLILSQSKPLFVSEPATLTAQAAGVDLPMAFDCNWVAQLDDGYDVSFTPVEEVVPPDHGP